jgi:hypothetical protein
VEEVSAKAYGLVILHLAQEWLPVLEPAAAGLAVAAGLPILLTSFLKVWAEWLHLATAQTPDLCADSSADQTSAIRCRATFARRTDLAFEELNQLGQRTEYCVNAIGKLKARGVFGEGVFAQPTL